MFRNFMLLLFFFVFTLFAQEEISFNELFTGRTKPEQNIFGTHYYGVYFGNTYAGSVKSEISEIVYQQKASYNLKITGNLVLSSFISSSRKEEAIVFADLSIAKGIVIEEDEKGGEKSWKEVIVERQGESLNFTRKTQKGEQPKKIDHFSAKASSGLLTVGTDFFIPLFLHKAKENEIYTFESFSFDKGEIVQEQFRIGALETIPLMSGNKIARKISYFNYKNEEKMNYWISSDGRILRMNVDGTSLQVLWCPKEKLGVPLNEKLLLTKPIPSAKKASLSAKTPFDSVYSFYQAKINNDPDLLDDVIDYKPFMYNGLKMNPKYKSITKEQFEAYWNSDTLAVINSFKEGYLNPEKKPVKQFNFEEMCKTGVERINEETAEVTIITPNKLNRILFFLHKKNGNWMIYKMEALSK